MDVNDEFRAAREAFAIDLQRTRDHVAFAIAAAAAHPGSDRLPDVDGQWRPSPQPFDPEIVRRSLPAWLIANGFREHTESATAFLERINAGMRRWAPADVRRRWSKNLRRDVGEKHFHAANLPDKVETLVSAYACPVQGRLMDAVHDVFGVRNCLVHRRGVVGLKDIERSGELTLNHMTVVKVFVGPGGERPAVLPRSHDERVDFRVEDWAESRWKLGERVDISAPQFNDLTVTMTAFGFWVERAAANVLWDWGLIPMRPSSMGAPIWTRRS